MPLYSYIAKTLQGETKAGILEAKNQQEVAKLLRQEECILISASLSGESPRKKKVSFSLPFFNKVSLAEKMMFSRNLQVMISAGISLPRALVMLSEQVKNKKFKKCLINIAEEITRGETLSGSFAEHPDIFSELFVSMIKVGEEAGTLEDVLKVLVRQMEREHELKSKITGAMVYPAVIIVTMMGIGVLMLIMVVPKLADTFKELGISLPLTTRIVIGLGIFTAKFWYLILIGILALMLLLRAILKTKPGKFIFDTFILRIPFFSNIVRKTNSVYTTRTLGSLLLSGVPIVRALEITSGTLKNTYYKKAVQETAEKMKKGTKLASSFQEYKKIYPALVVQMIAVGEETGKTSEMLEKIADFYEEEITQVTKNLASVIEPILMVIIGGVVGFFVISMVQPMYGMIQGFK